MNALARLIAAQCAAAGPITVAEFMAMALGHPRHGYYMTRQPFGREGDFTTAPEICQIFGELIGLWCVETWRLMGSPARFVFAELGPGRGTMMADALRAARLEPEFLAAAEIHLVETSPLLRDRQQRTLAGYSIDWHDHADALPEGPLLLIANEFFDALPVRQLARTRDGWRERLVAGGETGLHFVLSGRETPAAALLAPKLRHAAPVGAVAEVQPSALTLAAAIGARISQQGGAALIVDYGYVASAAGETLQAVRRHRRHEILDGPGTADLTAHVDFDALIRAVDGTAVCFGPVDQGDFLRRLGIALRAQQLTGAASPDQAALIASGVKRLIAPDQMGTLFKVLAMAQPGMGSLPGFEGAIE